MKNTFAKVILLCMIGINLPACNTSVSQLEGSNDPSVIFFKPAESEDNNKAILYIYRPWRFGSGWSSPLIYINNEEIVQLVRQRHTWISVEAGKYLIETRLNKYWVRGKPDRYELVAESGQSYFISVGTKTNVSWWVFIVDLLTGSRSHFMGGTDFNLTLQEQTEALEEIKETLYLKPERKFLP